MTGSHTTPRAACPKCNPRAKLNERGATPPRHRGRPRLPVRAVSRRPNRWLGRGRPATRSRGWLRYRSGGGAGIGRGDARTGNYSRPGQKKEPPRGGSTRTPFPKWGFSLAGPTPTSLAVIRDSEPARRQNGELPIPAVGENTDSGGRSKLIGEASNFRGTRREKAPSLKLKAQWKHQAPRTMRGAARLRRARGGAAFRPQRRPLIPSAATSPNASHRQPLSGLE